MNQNSQTSAEQAAAFQKIWIESMSKFMQAAYSMGPESTPPEMARLIRNGVFQSLAKSWEEFMRSPQFLQGMRQWMDGMITFRKLTNDYLAGVRNELQAPSRDDIDQVLLAMRHMEKRLLDRVDELSDQMSEVQEQLAKGRQSKVANKVRTS